MEQTIELGAIQTGVLGLESPQMSVRHFFLTSSGKRTHTQVGKGGETKKMRGKNGRKR